MIPPVESAGLSALPRRTAYPRVVAPGPPGDSFPLIYRIARGSCAGLLHGLFDLRVTGLEHVPATGPFILAANHHNYLDGLVLGVAVPRPVSFLVMPRVWHASPVHPLLHRLVGSIRLDVERPDPVAIRHALRALRDDGVVGIFPEGPFSREGRLVRGQPGVGLIALRSGAPVVPAAIRGTWEALRGRRFYVPRRHPLSVHFGPPLRFERGRRCSGTVRDAATGRIMREIAALLVDDAEPVGSGR